MFATFTSPGQDLFNCLLLPQVKHA